MHEIIDIQSLDENETEIRVAMSGDFYLVQISGPLATGTLVMTLDISMDEIDEIGEMLKEALKIEINTKMKELGN